jgi:chromosome segregation protein
MVYIKKLVMHGFKSFIRKTEIPFTEGINVIIGPNGSGKSNVSDALCFVLGRLSAKSMRAAKAGNLIFFGTKDVSPAREAAVEVVFDNSDNGFSQNSGEVSVKRIVRRNGQSIYKLNDEVKTRQEILSLLAQAGIDPNGFNIILQGEIQNFVRMHNEERRRIIEEVSGISVYETRKEKSLHELEKTDEKLKEVLAILRERTSYLNNLEKERQQALKFKKLESDARKFKASIISFDISKRKKELDDVNEGISRQNKGIEKVRKEIAGLEEGIKSFESRISGINSIIQKTTGVQQENLNQEIANIRAELAGMGVKLENFEMRLSSLQKQKHELAESVRENESSIKELSGSSPKSRKEKDMAAKKKELEALEDERKKFYTIKSELKSVKERIDDKKALFQSGSNESSVLVKHMESTYRELFDRNSDAGKLENLRISMAEKKRILSELSKREIELEKISYSNEKEIEKSNHLIEKISKMDVCPVCKSKITANHVEHIHGEVLPRIVKLKEEIGNSDRELSDIYKKREVLSKDIEQISSEILKREGDMIKLSAIEEKKASIKAMQEKLDMLKGEISELENIRKRLEKSFDDSSGIEQRYEIARVEVQEISMRSDENIGSEISFKKRELERAKISLKQIERDEHDIEDDISALKEDIDERQELLQRKRRQEEELANRFNKLISERDSMNKRIRENELQISSGQNVIQGIEQAINNLKIDKAKIDAMIENLEIEMMGFDNAGIIKAGREILAERLAKTEEAISRIGTVNMRALEVYDSVKAEYDAVREKTDVISREKESILRIIQEIDVKKKKTFMKTINSLNEIFSRNFSQVSMKGRVYLELENPKEPFEAGVGITVKTGHGKYIDVTSLSGGEQTLVAISLIFAIQELNPYCFYILDEIDAALDKRNSERLAGLLSKYMRRGQYIVISHNDEIISNATNIYGVSMQDGISKVISLKV